jgi:hypothetical protein
MEDEGNRSLYALRVCQHYLIALRTHRQGQTRAIHKAMFKFHSAIRCPHVSSTLHCLLT